MWLLTYNSVTKSFAAWGLSNLRRSRVSQAQDTVSFTAPGPYDAAELFPYASTILISYDPSDPSNPSASATPWFMGRVTKVPRSGSGSAESMDYELAGPWWFLDNLVYQQIWAADPQLHPYTLAPGQTKLGEQTINDVHYDLIGIYKSRIILGQTQVGTRLTSGQVIADVIAYAIASGAPIAMGTIEPNLLIPFDEQSDITCAEAIRRMLRWSPDAVTWFDYSTTPYPTFHCKRRPALSPLSLDLDQSDPSNPSAASSVQVTPRPDIQVPAVVLKFEQPNSVNGVSYESIVTDKWPAIATGREFSDLIATLQLAGSQTSYVTQKIEVRGWGVGWWASDAFWRNHDPSIADTDVFELSFVSGTADPGTDYPSELICGQIQDWMSVHSKRYGITAVCQVTIHGPEGDIVREEFRTLSCEIIVTDAETKTYASSTTLDSGEPIPIGLAKAVYDSLNPLQYEVSVTLTEQECGLNSDVGGALRAATGFVLNLTNGPPAWSTMAALIQKVDEEVDSGRTTITCGPAEQLSPQDMVERLRTNRGRGVAIDYSKRHTGESSSGGSTVALSGPTPLLNTADAAGRTKLIVLTDDTRKITLDPAQLSLVNKWKVLTVTSETTAGFNWMHAHA